MKLSKPGFRRTALVAGLCLSLGAFAAPSLSPATAAPTSGSATEPTARVAVKLRPAKGLGLRVKPAKPGRTWIGALRTGKTRTNNYAIDPNLRLPRRINNATLTSRVDGSGAKPREGSSQRTAQAAYVAATWGAAPESKAQGAAVELALNHLLQKKQWGLTGKKTLRRTKFRNGRKAVRLAKQMVTTAAAFAGPYRVNLNNVRASAGESSALTATVLAASGTGMRGIDVQFSVDGKDAGTATTNPEGIASIVYTPTNTGKLELSATAGNLPGSSLALATPTKPTGASRIVLAQQAAESLQSRAEIAVAGTQAVTMIKPVDVRAGVPVAPVVKYEKYVSGGSPNQGVTSFLYGPFPSEDAANGACTRQIPATVQASGQVTIGGQVSAPTLTPPSEGWFAIAVELAGNEFNNAVRACGAVSKVNRVANIVASITKVGGPYSDANGVNWQKVRLSYAISNLPANYSGILDIRLAGDPAGGTPPCADYSSPTLGNQLQITGPGTYSTETDVNVKQSTAFRGFLSGSDFMPAIQTGCSEQVNLGTP